ncbi:hypothetical protein F5Y00DRAFT_262793 [Daldinia vernicosa]|uniref:uncharacterized protein n=1 Tax=Daldinia vernicosa TaxID=114800 RepID=UPI0020087B51|nr:uncharacterized protein F5Y00DRAFT_262793 [Daldinia vernicosa]KAI0848158.1 hypothetical protein F5Y00DRAFT_262793 [Daldinia vernicosa]
MASSHFFLMLDHIASYQCHETSTTRRTEMGNILGSQRVFYVGYEYTRSSVHGSSDDISDGSQERDLSGGWGGNVVGVKRRKGCITRDHWALKFRPGIDASQLPRRIKGFRTKIPSRCKENCG